MLNKPHTITAFLPLHSTPKEHADNLIDKSKAEPSVSETIQHLAQKLAPKAKQGKLPPLPTERTSDLWPPIMPADLAVYV